MSVISFVLYGFQAVFFSLIISYKTWLHFFYNRIFDCQSGHFGADTHKTGNLVDSVNWE